MWREVLLVTPNLVLSELQEVSSITFLHIMCSKLLPLQAAKVVKMMPAKDLTNLSSEAEKYLRLLQK